MSNHLMMPEIVKLSDGKHKLVRISHTTIGSVGHSELYRLEKLTNQELQEQFIATNKRIDQITAIPSLIVKPENIRR